MSAPTTGQVPTTSIGTLSLTGSRPDPAGWYPPQVPYDPPPAAETPAYGAYPAQPAAQPAELVLPPAPRPGAYGRPGPPPGAYAGPHPGGYAGPYPGPHPGGYAGAYPAPGPPLPVPGIATTAMVLGIVAASGTLVGIAFLPLLLLTLPVGVLGFVLGLVARRRVREQGLGGRGQALAGLLTGAISAGLALLVLVVVALFFATLLAGLSTGG